MTKEAVNKEILDIQLLPKAEQIPRWRKWAETESEPRLQQEAFVHLSWAKDKAEHPRHDQGPLVGRPHRARNGGDGPGRASVRPTPTAPRRALLKALGEATSADKPQICWALVALHEASAFDTVMAEYRLGHLATVQRLDGYPAFDAEMLAGLVPIDKIAALAGDESDSVRQLVATTLSKSADPKWTDTLIKLVKDKQVEVAREAAVGLGKIGNDRATQPLVDALSKADKASREKFLQALRDGMGANGLVLALKTVQHTTAESEKFQTKQLFDMMRELQDPRGADALYAYIQTNPKPHWKLEAAMRMAEIGDVRAAEVLGWRMQQDPLKLYNDVDWPELRRDDNERVYGGAAPGRPRGDPPGEARLPPEDRRAGRALLGRPGQQAAAARQRHALPRGRGIAEGHPDARALGRPRRASCRTRARSRPSRRPGRRRRARCATSGRRRTRAAGPSSRSSSTGETASSTSRGTRSCRAASPSSG